MRVNTEKILFEQTAEIDNAAFPIYSNANQSVAKIKAYAALLTSCEDNSPPKKIIAYKLLFLNNTNSIWKTFFEYNIDVPQDSPLNINFLNPIGFTMNLLEELLKGVQECIEEANND